MWQKMKDHVTPQFISLDVRCLVMLVKSWPIHLLGSADGRQTILRTGLRHRAALGLLLSIKILEQNDV
jgi:hypothetical protein